MTAAQLETRLSFVEGLIARADPKDLPALNATHRRLMDRLVALDLKGESDERAATAERHR